MGVGDVFTWMRESVDQSWAQVKAKLQNKKAGEQDEKEDEKDKKKKNGGVGWR